jgi:hypothetical protein
MAEEASAGAPPAGAPVEPDTAQVAMENHHEEDHR